MFAILFFNFIQTLLIIYYLKFHTIRYYYLLFKIPYTYITVSNYTKMCLTDVRSLNRQHERIFITCDR